MEIEPRKIRIISGTPADVEAELNELIKFYAPVVWNIGPGTYGALVTVVLIHESEVRKAAIAQNGQIMPGRRP